MAVEATITKDFDALRIASPAHLAWTVSGGKWIPYDHLLHINERFMAMVRGEFDRLMIFTPPQHGKSTFTSMYVPSWWLGKFPDRNVILTSYASSYASLWGRRTRDIMEEWGPELFDVGVSSSTKASDEWDLSGGRGGGMVAVGVRGAITGRGAHLGIIDDPVKNDQEANSKTYRDSIWEWYKSTFVTRIRQGGKIILIMTRWNEDDLAGRLLQEMKNGEGDQWEIIELPALARKPGELDALGMRQAFDPLGRAPGEPLCPELFDRELLEKRKTILGTYWWSALYDQRPSPESGMLFKRTDFRYFWREGPFYMLATPEGNKAVDMARCWIFQTVDTAATESESSDYFVCATWAVTPTDDLLLLDVFREKAETTKHEAIMASQRAKWSPTFQAVENQSFGTNLIQAMRKGGHPVRPLTADRDKVSRARLVAARYESGFVYHMRGAEWLHDFEKELVDFPNGAHDDQVDAAAYAAVTVMLDSPTTLETGTFDIVGWT